MYRHELEKEYNFSDLVETFPLFRGKGSREETTEQVVGYLKVSIVQYSQLANVLPKLYDLTSYILRDVPGFVQLPVC